MLGCLFHILHIDRDIDRNGLLPWSYLGGRKPSKLDRKFNALKIVLNFLQDLQESFQVPFTRILLVGSIKYAQRMEFLILLNFQSFEKRIEIVL